MFHLLGRRYMLNGSDVKQRSASAVCGCGEFVKMSMLFFGHNVVVFQTVVLYRMWRGLSSLVDALYSFCDEIRQKGEEL